MKSTQRLYDRLRLRILELTVEESRLFSGEVEIDESYFGACRVRGKRGRGAGGKTPVVCLLKRGGRVFTEIVENCSKAALTPVIKGQVLSEATVYTDGWKSDDGLVLGGCKHHPIHHHQNQFARGRNHVNGIESFWSFTKLRLSKLRGIRAGYFIIHLKESEWRWNHRHIIFTSSSSKTSAQNLSKTLLDYQKAKRSRRVPVVLTAEECRRVFVEMSGRWRLMAELMYGSGLRVIELVTLRVKDLDVERRQLTVRMGKGGKDRVTVLPEKLVSALEEHLERLRRLFAEDRGASLPGVAMEAALARKYLGAGTSWACSPTPQPP